jgi:TM2 domain-containing membrane protein YozV
MYIHQCPECGKQYSTQEKVNRVKCPYCGAETNVSYSEQDGPNYQEQWRQFSNQASNAIDSVFNNGPSGKSRGIAGLLAILMGWCGLHYFYIGKTSAGVLFLLIAVLSCGILATITTIVSIIQGVLFFTSTQEEFEFKWVNSPSNFPLF